MGHFSSQLRRAAWKLHARCLSGGADRDRAAEDGTTPRFRAKCFGHVQVARLLELSADKDLAKADGGRFVAAEKGHLEVARLLLEFAADKEATANGATPHSLQHMEVACLLLSC